MIKAAGIIIYKNIADSQDFKFLLLKASDKPFHWTPPKGKLDPGEDNIQAAYRETLEESGLHKDVIQLDDNFIETLHYQAHGDDKECIYYLGKLLDDNAEIKLSEEHQNYAWVDIKEIPDYCTKESLCKMFTNAHNYLKCKK